MEISEVRKCGANRGLCPKKHFLTARKKVCEKHAYKENEHTSEVEEIWCSNNQYCPVKSVDGSENFNLARFKEGTEDTCKMHKEKKNKENKKKRDRNDFIMEEMGNIMKKVTTLRSELEFVKMKTQPELMDQFGWCLYRDDVDTLKELIQKYPLLLSMYRNKHGYNALQDAILKESHQCIQFFEEKLRECESTGLREVLMNGGAKNGSTALHKAAYKGDADVTKLLLDLGANFNARTVGNWLPLHNAASQKHKQAVKMLADAHLTDDDREANLILQDLQRPSEDDRYPDEAAKLVEKCFKLFRLY
mmetsp:Transcript_29580/g.36551  ORF Transcript_29580/g.36551 Transcript_29580/m.36551 type:complete len:305 (+) Transcript_29580:360-1274(+)